VGTFLNALCAVSALKNICNCIATTIAATTNSAANNNNNGNIKIIDYSNKSSISKALQEN